MAAAAWWSWRVRIIANVAPPGRSSQRLYVGLLPRPYLGACGVEDALVVALADLEARLRRELRPDRIPQVIDAQLRRLVRRCHVVGTEQKTVRMAVEHRRDALFDFRVCNGVFSHLVPGDVVVHVAERRVVHQFLDDLTVRGTALLGVRGGLRLHG